MGWADDAPTTQFDPGIIFGTAALPPPLAADAPAPPPGAGPVPLSMTGGLQANPDVLPGTLSSASSAPNGAPQPGGAPGSRPGQAIGNLPPDIARALGGALNPPTGKAGGILGNVFGMDPGQASRFMSGLGTGLASVGQNWNKPMGAAFAASAGSAIQGGQQAQNQQQDQRLKSINAAIHAWQIGDMAKYHQSLADYHAALVSAKSGDTSGSNPAAPAAPIWAAPTNVYGPPVAPPAVGQTNAPPAAPAPPAAAPPTDTLAQARAAIARGADPAAVRARLRQMGVDPAGLDLR
jgi:hypothetical protein